MHKTPIVSLIFTFLFSLFFTWAAFAASHLPLCRRQMQRGECKCKVALHVIFSGQTVDSHVMFLVARHLLHQGGIFTQRTNDVGIESGTVKVTGLVLFQQIQGSLVRADNEMFTVEAVAQFQISFVLGRPAKHKEFEKSIFNGCHIFGVHSLFARQLDLALKVAGHR